MSTLDISCKVILIYLEKDVKRKILFYRIGINEVEKQPQYYLNSQKKCARVEITLA